MAFVTCTRCNGSGRDMARCAFCHGTGFRDGGFGSQVMCMDCFGTGRQSCFQCKGSGGKYEENNNIKSRRPKTCTRCNGSGRDMAQCGFCQGTGFRDGGFGSRVMCMDCGGTGRQLCFQCKGSGEKYEESNIRYSPTKTCTREVHNFYNESKSRLELAEFYKEAKPPYDKAYKLASQNKYKEALDCFLDIIKNKQDKEGKAKEAMIILFSVLGTEHELTLEYRAKLNRLIFI